MNTGKGINRWDLYECVWTFKLPQACRETCTLIFKESLCQSRSRGGAARSNGTTVTPPTYVHYWTASLLDGQVHHKGGGELLRCRDLRSTEEPLITNYNTLWFTIHWVFFMSYAAVKVKFCKHFILTHENKVKHSCNPENTETAPTTTTHPPRRSLSVVVWTPQM